MNTHNGTQVCDESMYLHRGIAVRKSFGVLPSVRETQLARECTFVRSKECVKLIFPGVGSINIHDASILLYMPAVGAHKLLCAPRTRT